MWSRAGATLIKTIALFALRAAKERLMVLGLDATDNFADAENVQSLLRPFIDVEGNFTSSFATHSPTDAGFKMSLESSAAVVNLGLMIAGWFRRRALQR